MATTIAELIVTLDIKGEGAKKLGAFDGALDKSETRTKKFKAGLAGAGKALAAFGAVAVVAAAGIFKLVQNVTQSGDEIAKTSKQLQIAASDLQRLRFATERSGGSAAGLTKSLRTLTKGLEDARLRGTGPVADGLETLGLKVSDLEGLGAEDTIGLLGDALKGVEDPARRSAIAMQFFGAKGGAELVPLLLEGKEGIRALGDEAESLGLVMGGKALAASEAFQDQMTNLRGVLTGLKNTLGIALLPLVRDTIRRITDWAKANRAVIATKIQEFVKRFIGVVEQLVPLLVRMVDSFFDFVDAIGGVENGLKLAAAAMIGLKLATSGMPGLFVAVGAAGFAAGKAIATSFLDADGVITKTRNDIVKLRGQISRLKSAISRAKEDIAADEAATVQAQEATRAGFGAEFQVEGSAVLSKEGGLVANAINRAAAVEQRKQRDAAIKAAREGGGTAAEIGAAGAQATQEARRRFDARRAEAAAAATTAFRETGDIAAAQKAGQEAVSGIFGGTRKKRKKGRGKGRGGRGKRGPAPAATPPPPSAVTLQQLLTGEVSLEAERPGALPQSPQISLNVTNLRFENRFEISGEGDPEQTALRVVTLFEERTAELLADTARKTSNNVLR